MPEIDNNIEFIIGFDLGHAESSVSAINLRSKDNIPSTVEIYNEKSFITAIGYTKNKETLIGETAVIEDEKNLDSLFTSFKKRPVKDDKYNQIMCDYINDIFQYMKNSRYGFKDDNILVYAGCPTDWCKDNELIKMYENIFNKVGINKVFIVAESRGALMSIQDKIELGHQKALIIDLGSSTADFTFINLQNYLDQDPLDFGCDLGGSIIDRLIFRDILNKHQQKEKLISIFKDNPSIKNKCELACRRAKEAWFTTNIRGTSTINIYVYIIPDELDFKGNINSEKMEKILDEPISDLNDVDELFFKGNINSEKMEKILDELQKKYLKVSISDLNDVDELFFKGNINSEKMEKILDEPISDLNDVGKTYDQNLDIDRLIFQDILNNHQQKEKLISIFKDNPLKENLCEIKCRRAKEAWFSNTRTTQTIFVEILPDELFFRGKINSEKMTKLLGEICNQNYVYNNSWPQEFEKQLIHAKEHANPDIIALTGGVSRMPFIKKTCEKIFPNTIVSVDLEPELSIAKGLAIWGHTDFLSKTFAADVRQVLNEHLKDAIEKDLDNAFAKISTDVVNDAIAFTLTTIIPWQKTSDSISILKKNLEIKSKEWNGRNRVVKIVNIGLAQYLSLITTNINKDYFVDIAKKYKIPNPESALDGTHRVNVFIESIDRPIGDETINEAIKRMQQDLMDSVQGIIYLLGGAIIAVLLAAGVGIIPAAALAAYTMIYGEKKAQEMIESVALPPLIKGNRAADKINEQRPEITNRVLEDFKKNTVVKNSIISAGQNAIEVVMDEQVKELRKFLGR